MVAVSAVLLWMLPASRTSAGHRDREWADRLLFWVQIVLQCRTIALVLPDLP